MQIIVALLVLVFSCREKPGKDQPEALLPFIPEHYTLADTARGDLNRDGISDLVMVLNPPDDSLSAVEERPLLLLLGQKNNTYKEALRHQKVVFCTTCGGILGDPYQQITIRNGEFTVEHFGGSSWKWARTTTFTYMTSKETWYLKEDAFVSYHGGDPDNIETRILSPRDFGEIPLAEFDVYKQ